MDTNQRVHSISFACSATRDCWILDGILEGIIPGYRLLPSDMIVSVPLRKVRVAAGRAPETRHFMGMPCASKRPPG